MGALYPHLSDEQLLERLRYQAGVEEAELVEEQRDEDDWLVAFKRFDAPVVEEAITRSAEGPLREAREALLYQVEQRR